MRPRAVVPLLPIVLIAATTSGQVRDLGRATVEVREQVLADRVRVTYTVRHIAAVLSPPIVPLSIADTSPADAVTGFTPPIPDPGVVEVVIGNDLKRGTPSLQSMPLKVDAPDGWHPQLLGVGEEADRKWRLSWTCADAGRSHLLAHRIRSGDTLTFAVELPRSDSTYSSAGYELTFDGFGHMSGKVFPGGKH
jgi:hypothetical protein